MKTTVAIMGLILGLAAPIVLFGLIICLLSLVDVQAQFLGIGQD